MLQLMEELGSPFPQSFPTIPATANLPTPSNAPDHLSTQPLSADEVVKKYPRLRGDSKMGKLAIALAKECFFWKRCDEQLFSWRKRARNNSLARARDE